MNTEVGEERDQENDDPQAATVVCEQPEESLSTEIESTDQPLTLIGYILIFVCMHFATCIYGNNQIFRTTPYMILYMNI